MGTRGKNINLYLMDGDPSKRIKCTLANWTGVAYKIPRTELDKCKEREDLSQSGVYFLFGVLEQTNMGVVYVGQAGVRKNGEGILYRLQEHKRDSSKDYWTEAVVFTTSNDSFGPTEITYLENRFCHLANEAKRYVVKNSNDPASGHITEEKESELEEFVDYSKIVMGTLGHRVFEPVLQTSTTAKPTEEPEPKEKQLFFIKRGGADATCKITDEGIVVLAGSTIRKNTVQSCRSYIKALREDHKKNMTEDGVLLTDVLFKTPSGASSFVLGAQTNGTIEWKTSDGTTLKEVENSEEIV